MMLTVETLLAAKRALARPSVIRVLKEFDKIDRLMDLEIIATLHWGARFWDPCNNPFR